MIIDENRLHWLAGLLEGEAYFSLTRPSKHNGPQPHINIVMKDADIIQQVADIFGVSTVTVTPRKAHWSTTYLTRIQSKQAYFLMQILQPLMGQRRQTRIQEILSTYVYVPDHVGSNNESAKLSEAQVRQIKIRIAQGETAKSIAPDFGVSHYNIWAIRCGKTWSHVSIDGDDTRPTSVENPIKIIPVESQEEKTFHWLAGLLEGEGSFVPPPPSAPNQPAIQLSMTDEDVVQRVADLFGLKMQRWQSKNPQHKLAYMVHLRGSRAVDYMRQLYPLMGQRRQAQIEKALSTYVPHDQRGDKNPRSKLNTEQVTEIKIRLRNGEKPASIAPDFGVNPFTILDIKLGRTWRHVEL